MAKKVKFKIGDKVKILPSATGVTVWKEEVGKIGRVTSIRYDSFYVRMLNPCKGKLRLWSVGDNMIALIVKVGQQLLFEFMQQS